jgi:hypothetical protein
LPGRHAIRMLIPQGDGRDHLREICSQLIWPGGPSAPAQPADTHASKSADISTELAQWMPATVACQPTQLKKGERRVGRVKGVPNKRTKEVAEVLETAASKIGGVNRLVEWIKERPENEYAFWTSMYLKLLPVQVAGQGPRGAIELNVTIDADELGKRLEERGLPARVFGFDAPVIDLEVEPVGETAEPEKTEPDMDAA